jgi:guanylate kinase
MKNAYGEVSHAHYYDYVVVNDDLKDATEKVNCILIAEKCRIKRCNNNFENFREG